MALSTLFRIFTFDLTFEARFLRERRGTTTENVFEQNVSKVEMRADTLEQRHIGKRKCLCRSLKLDCIKENMLRFHAKNEAAKMRWTTSTAAKNVQNRNDCDLLKSIAVRELHTPLMWSLVG